MYYGDDVFLVGNFPFPAMVGNGLERLMAYDAGYITYTNSADRVLTVRKLDYGTPCIKIWSPEEIAAVKQKAESQKSSNAERVLRSNQDAADKGDAYGLLRMGERYRDGDGVPKDLAKAKDYLTKAAAAGSPTADDELKVFPKQP
jgi:TPR repeat protein